MSIGKFLLCAILISGCSTGGTYREGTDLNWTVSFARDNFVKSTVVHDVTGGRDLEVSCYSLDDNHREDFATKHGTDPVADLSCYVHDMSRPMEYTMLATPGEPLQFTPGFFWLSDVEKCQGKNYVVDARVRGMRIRFALGRVAPDTHLSEVKISVSEDTAAINDRLMEDSYSVQCADE